jgi:thioredoxin-like negative regulator of GroEL
VAEEEDGMKATELPNDLQARADRHNEEFAAMCAPFDELTQRQRDAALNHFVGWVGSQAMRGDEEAKALFQAALEAARRVE